MKIIVAVKQVPVRDSLMHIDSSGKWLEEQDLSFEINEPDAYALEAALLLKEKHGGEVVVLCAGPERAGQTIREVPAGKGLEKPIHRRCDGTHCGRHRCNLQSQRQDLFRTVFPCRLYLRVVLEPDVGRGSPYAHRILLIVEEGD